MYDYNSYNWSHWNGNEKLKEILEAMPGKHLIDSLQQTAVSGTSHTIRKVLQCEWWGSPLVQEKYREEKACDDDDDNNNNNNNLYTTARYITHYFADSILPNNIQLLTYKHILIFLP
jgi:hypothetical protein